MHMLHHLMSLIALFSILDFPFFVNGDISVEIFETKRGPFDINILMFTLIDFVCNIKKKYLSVRNILMFTLIFTHPRSN